MRCENFDNIIHLEKVDSTNSYVKKNSEKLSNGAVVFAAEQTSGKGRLTRKWFSEKGKSVTCSFLIKNINDNADAVRLSFLFSLAVKNTLAKYIDYSKICLKWPNDVLVSKKKICGILSEYSKGCAIIGIGINSADFDLPQDLGQPWTSIETEAGKKICLNDLQKELVKEVNTVFRRYCTNDLKDLPYIWFREADIINTPVSVSSGKLTYSGSVKSIDDKGILYILDKNSDEIISISFGDVTYNDKF